MWSTSAFCIIIFLCCLCRCVRKKCSDGKTVEPLHVFKGSETTERKPFAKGGETSLRINTPPKKKQKKFLKSK